jgi:hypothetical protein
MSDVTRFIAGHPVTPDRRYFVVRGRLWRRANPALDDDELGQMIKELMQARLAVGAAKRAAQAIGRLARGKCLTIDQGLTPNRANDLVQIANS